MKKHLFFLAAGAAVALTACTSEDVVDDVAKSSRNAIKFETAVSKASRAEDLTMNTLLQFNVFGFYTMPEDSTHVNKLFEDVAVQKKDGLWSYDAKDIHYWVPDAQYRFYAYSCGSVSKLNTDKFGKFSLNMANDDENPLNPSERVLVIESYLCDYTHQHDLVCASNLGCVGKPEGQSNDAVTLDFKHVLTKVEAAFTNNFTSEYDVVIRNVSIESIWNEGDFNFLTGWSNVRYDKINSSPLVYLLDTEGQGGSKAAPITATQDMNGDKKVAAVTDYAYVIPAQYKGDNKAIIKFTIDVMMGNDKVLTKTLKATINPEWKTGYAYRYNIEVSPSTTSMQQIEFNVTSVSSWNTNNPDESSPEEIDTPVDR